MSQQRTKKAKLAHEKQSPKTASGKPRGEYGIQRVEALVEWPAGTPAAVVEIDTEGTRAIVGRAFVTVDPATGAARPGLLACPAVYSPAARAQAIAAFRAFEAAAPAAQAPAA